MRTKCENFVLAAEIPANGSLRQNSLANANAMALLAKVWIPLKSHSQRSFREVAVEPLGHCRL